MKSIFLIVAASDIEGGHDLPLESNYILEQLHIVIKAVKFWCGDNYIINNVTLNYSFQVVKHVN